MILYIHSVRSTNVYEEKSLGVFTDEDEESVDDTFNPTGNRAAVWGRYLAMHARKQLSFGAYASSRFSGYPSNRLSVKICGGSVLRFSSCALWRSVIDLPCMVAVLISNYSGIT